VPTVCITAGSTVDDSATGVLVAAMSTPPSAARRTLIQNCIVALQDAGIWDELDVLYLFAAADSQAACLNWKAPASNVAVPTNTPTFTADRGYAGNGTTSYVDTTFAPATHGVNWTQNDASLWVWCLTDSQNSARDAGNMTAPLSSVVARSGSGAFNGHINQGGASTFGAISNSLGMTGVQRRGATDLRGWRDGVQHGSTQTTVSTAVTTQSLWVCGGNATSFNTRQESFFAAGASLTGLEATFFNIIGEYLAGVGAIDPLPLGAPGSWTLAFEDHFDDPTLDSDRWNPNWLDPGATATPPINSAEICAYHVDNVTIADSCLILTASETSTLAEGGNTYPWRSGMVEGYPHGSTTGVTVNVNSFSEARIWMPDNGTRPSNFCAFWQNAWPADWRHETDTMENLSDGPEWHYHTEETLGSAPPDVSTGGDSPYPEALGGTGTGWHTYGVRWVENASSGDAELYFYYDGTLIGSKLTGVREEIQYLVLNHAISDEHGPQPPQAGVMKVDYVRTWTKRA
jgi:hypothetical protein